MSAAALPSSDAGPRDRLLLAAAELLEAAQGAEVSTRAICQRAGVQAPTLYHHFGSKRGLEDAVVTHGFKQFLSERAELGGDGDPIDDIRMGWDLHVRYGLENPYFYGLIYGRVIPGKPMRRGRRGRGDDPARAQPAAARAACGSRRSRRRARSWRPARASSSR